MNVGNIITVAWHISDKTKKEIIVRFYDNMSKIERDMSLRLISEKWNEIAEREDAEESGGIRFGKLIREATLRECGKEDEEAIRSVLRKIRNRGGQNEEK